MSRSTKRTFFKQFDTGQHVSLGLFTHCGLRFVNYIFVNHRVAVTQCSCLLNPLDHQTPDMNPIEHVWASMVKIGHRVPYGPLLHCGLL